MSAIASDQYQALLRIIAEWPAEERIAFVRDVLGTLNDAARSKQPRDTAGRAWGLARVDGPPPDDAEVARILDEHRMGKYGR